ncbi:hypothetical protein EIN_341360 [Entamoeba invadens IP1]|uniref:Uncharacterized protein n=1 Tax=Entamoeba invadens IP1 TaxID=370355 RepID=A0A0A1UGC2_ENTIV|nr:hypothetical protein EIN_341360 [Entamoeba invadens IP1]ELP94758.1 hypothetical protein EIN_341360 [Entamoeba invadens IP1]|eukprot:XP_004261529.1 hypothetical protein EIN_341360 [Entamoeba invadens IP1]
MHRVKLSIALSECLSSKTPSQKQVDYVVKSTFKGDGGYVTQKVVSQIHSMFLKTTMNSLTTFHSISMFGNLDVFKSVEDVIFVNNKTEVYMTNTTQLSYWCERYSVPLNMALLFHKKYNIFSGKYVVPQGLSLPISLRNYNTVNLMNVELKMIFHSFVNYIKDVLNHSDIHKSVNKSVVLSIMEANNIFRLINNLEIYNTILLNTKLEVKSLEKWRQELLEVINDFKVDNRFNKVQVDIPYIFLLKNNPEVIRNFVYVYPLPSSFEEAKYGPKKENRIVLNRRNIKQSVFINTCENGSEVINTNVCYIYSIVIED